MYGSPGGTFLLITYHLLLTNYYLSLITNYLSLITYYLLLIISLITPIMTGSSIVRKPWSTEALEGHFNLLLITYYLLLITYHLLLITYYLLLITYHITGPRSAVSNVSGNRCESDCRSRGRKFDPGPVPYFRGD